MLKWTEKRSKRSKSLPRGSEIDEIMGKASKPKPQSKFFPIPSVAGVGGAAPPLSTPPRRQSRVELYENDRRAAKKAQARFSLKKFFKVSFASTCRDVMMAHIFQKVYVTSNIMVK